VDIVRRVWSVYLTIRYFLARFLRGVGTIAPEYRTPHSGDPREHDVAPMIGDQHHPK
jgi:hypothetical protein